MSQRRMRVLMSYSRPGAEANPFTTNLAQGLGMHVDVAYLSPKTMLWKPFDVLHVHWPENLFRAAGWWRNAVKTFLGIVLMVRVIVRRRPIVYTRHNLAPHEEPGWLYGALYRWIDRYAKARIYLNESGENDPINGITILHGDYPPVRSGAGREAFNPSSSHVSMLFYGQVRRYKGVEDLVTAFVACGDSETSLRIMGAVPDAAYANELVRAISADSRIEFNPGFVSEGDLERALGEADVVVLPYRKVYNSGVALLALSRGLPILAPDGPSLRSLRDEVGGEFVNLFDGKISAHDIHSARMITARRAGLTPDLSRRDWGTICGLHARVYALAGDRRISRHGVRSAVARDQDFVRHSARNTLVVGSDLG